MKYKIYKFEFITGVHFGKRALEDAEYSLGADTIFSAVCQELVKKDSQMLPDFVEKTRAGKLVISDAFPYIGTTYYLPKPIWRIETENKQGDSTIKKAYKKLSYIPAEEFSVYLDGKLDVKRVVNHLKTELGDKEVKTSAWVRNGEETLPYRVGVYSFKPQSGLYIILGYQEESDLEWIEEIFRGIGFAGIGGKKHAGLGRFRLQGEELKKSMQNRLESQTGSLYMLLSGSMPKEDELEAALKGAAYLLSKRSGFVASSDYAPEQMRKRDFYLMQAGSCFGCRFQGDIYQVGEGGAHPVYRYAKPLFMEVF